MIYDFANVRSIKLGLGETVWHVIGNGLRGKMGKTTDPLEWRNNLNKK